MKYDLDKPDEIEKARMEYWAQPIIKKYKQWSMKEENRDYVSWDGPDQYRCDRQQYIQKARNHAIVTHAIVKDGKWYERGKMGWWAIITDNEKDEETWDSMANKMFDELPGDTILVLCDCHI